MGAVIPKGYKQTKVGLIPEDWEEFKLKDVLNLTLESLVMEDEKEYELITVRRRFGGVDSRGIFKGKKILVKNQFYVRENDFVISKRQISHGACGLVPKELDGAIVSNEYNVFQPNKDLLDQVFFNYYVRVPKFNQTFYSYSDGIHIEKLLFKTKSWLKQKIPFPPLKEQQKIAQILITWDDAISKQEALIKAKEELKKGLMQKLLSGEVRFKEFGAGTLVPSSSIEKNGTEVPAPGGWDEVRLGDISKINPKNNNLPESFVYIDLESVKNGTLLKESIINSDNAPSRAQRLLKKDDILYQTVRPYQKNNFFFKLTGNYVASTGYAQIRALESSEYLYHYLHPTFPPNYTYEITSTPKAS
ncbi:MAG: hypothetical protein COB07_11025 [Sulfurovum sp.]|nr:MAG: hypothetical protein COB07_11025 [Sulfurovum sp.]